MQKKILFVIDTLQTGGAERSILEITSRLNKFRPIVCVLFPKSPDLLGEFHNRSIDVIHLNLHGSMWLLEGRKKLKEIVKEYKPAIVHATLFNSELLTRITLNSKGPIQINSFVNDSYVKERYLQQTFIRNFKLNIYKFIDYITAKEVNHFISITESVAKSNAKALHIPLYKVTTIYRGRSVKNFEVKQPLITDQPFVFLTVARLLKRKGYVELLDATKILSQEKINFKVIIAGEGHDREAFEKITYNSNLQKCVTFLGNRKDIPELLNDAHCFVFPSHYEGQGGALVEAMLAGKPVIATRIPVFQEQVEDKVTGLLFNVFDHIDLASKMLWMYKNYENAKLMGEKARKIAEVRFDIDLIANKYEALYKKLLS